ncbi:MAG: type IV secretion system protein [Deltaproteobacteria bacterium]|nr:type IV secretion system protein [Deltaproteobacteria bacterium]
MAAAVKNTPVYDDQLIAWHNRRLWQLLCGAGAIIVVLAVSLCVVTLRPHSAPWVIEVNDKGEPVGGVLPLAGSEALSDITTRFAISEYIQDAFRVSPEFAEEQMMLGKVYGMSTGQASAALTAYYRADKDARNPLMVNGKYWQNVRVLRTLKLPPPSTYQVDFTTFRHDHNHETGLATNWRATLRVVQGRPTDSNTLGLFVTDLDFQPEAK